MTERLSTLLHDQASVVDVPTAPTADILTRGRGIRRRRRATAAVAVAATAVLVAGVATAAVSARHDDSVQPAGGTDQTAYEQRGAWAIGDDVHVGNHVVTVPGLDAIRYTSLGVLAWTQVPGEDAASTRATSVLISPDGSVHPLDLPGLDHFSFGPAATDPATPYIAYARATGEPHQAEVVVADLATGESSVLGKPFPARYPASSRISFVGEDVALNSVDRLDRTTGERTALDPDAVVTSDGYAGDRYVSTDMRGAWSVHDSDDGRTLLTVRPTASADTEGQAPSLSPDGRYFAVSTGTSGIDVYTVETGDSVHLGGDRDVSDYGWTPDGHLIGKPLTGASEVETCDPESGACTGLGVTVADPLVLVPGAGGLVL